MTTSINGRALAYILGDEPCANPLDGPCDHALVDRGATRPICPAPTLALVELRRQISHLAADVDAVLCQALPEARTKDQWTDAEPDRLLTPAAAAARFGVTKRWLLSHADEIPGLRRLSRKVVRFSERRLAQFLERRPV